MSHSSKEAEHDESFRILSGKRMIQFQDVYKSFGKIQALDNVSFDVQGGEIFGFLGPNGAGKTTTLNILSTLLNQDKGMVSFNGIDLNNDRDAFKSKIGIVPQEISLYEDLSAYDNLMFWGGLYGTPKYELRKTVDEVLELVGLADRKADSIKTYSGGMKRRVNIASSILHRPELLLLDEPTVGVDIQSRNRIFEIIERLNKEGMTIIYTTHYMEEVERLCDRIAIIDNGSIVAEGSLAALKETSQTKDILKIKVSNVSRDLIGRLEGLIQFNQSANTEVLEVVCDSISEELSTIINSIQSVGLEIVNIETVEANLESIFLKLTGKQLRD